MNPNVRTLQTSQAGMRLLAQTMIYNGGDDTRMRQFITDSYAADLLDQQPVDVKSAAFTHMRNVVGRIRLERVLGIDPHQVAALMSAEKLTTMFVIELRVHADYPHKISFYVQRPVEAHPVDE